MQKVVIRVIVGVVLVSAVAAAGAVFWNERGERGFWGVFGNPGDVRVDHRIAPATAQRGDNRGRGDRPDPQSGATEALTGSGDLEQTVRFDLDPKDDRDEISQVYAGQFIVDTTEGVRAYDIKTRKPRWRYLEPDRDTEQIAPVTNGTLVLQTVSEDEDAGEPGDEQSRFIALDAVTGQLLWERADDRWLLGGARSGVVMIGADNALLGLDARTGEERWRVVDRNPGCRWSDSPYRRSSDWSLGMISGDGCSDDRTRLVDPATGKVQWRHGDGRPPTLSQDTRIHAVQSGLTLLEGPEEPKSRFRPPILRDARGRTVFKGAPGSSGARADLARVEDTVVLTYLGANIKPRVTIVDLKTRRTETRTVPEVYQKLQVVGNKVYGFGVTDDGEPYSLAEIDPGTGRSTARSVLGELSSNGSTAPTWFGPVDGQVYIPLQSGELIEYAVQR